MPLRMVKPLDDVQWAKVKDMMKSGPTDTEIAVGKRALESAKKLKGISKSPCIISQNHNGT